MAIDIFVYATRNKLRFQSSRGELTVEQLWEVPLRAAGNYPDFSLNTIAKLANEQVKTLNEENFVETTRTAKHVKVETALEVIKFIIAVKIEEENKAKKHADNKKEKEQLLAALAEKQAGKLSEMTEQQLRKKIAALEVEE